MNLLRIITQQMRADADIYAIETNVTSALLQSDFIFHFLNNNSVFNDQHRVDTDLDILRVCREKSPLSRITRMGKLRFLDCPI